MKRLRTIRGAKSVGASPYQSLIFDIVVCDDQTCAHISTQKNHEAFRLMLLQLIFLMIRIRADVTLAIVLHQLGS